jgi:uncharacterized protein (TIGR00251 family)
MPVAGGIRLRLRVAPKAARSRIMGVHGGALKVAVTEAPERGRANAAVIELLARALGVPKKNIAIVSGETAQDKVIEIAGGSASALWQALGISTASPPAP